MRERQVVRNRGVGGWKVVRGETGTTQDRTNCQSAAIEQACSELRQNGGGQVLIYGLRGRIQDKRTIRPGH